MMGIVRQRSHPAGQAPEQVGSPSEIDLVAATFRRVLILSAALALLISVAAIAYIDHGSRLSVLAAVGTVAGVFGSMCLFTAVWASFHYAPRQN